MSEIFVPLAPGVFDKGDAGFTPLLSRKAAPVSATAATPEACAKPKVILQRNGEIVSGIRVECGCGQVVDLTCVY